MTTQPEALRLADKLEGHGTQYGETTYHKAAAELRRLHADAEEHDALRERLSELLRNTAIALRGPEPELTRWSWHDLPELASTLKSQRDALLEALKVMEARFGCTLSRSEYPRKTFACHHMAETCPNCEGLVTAWKAVQAARAAIKAVEGEKA